MKPMRNAMAAVVLIVFGLSAASCDGGRKTVEMRVNGHVFTVELARTPEERARGLMFRKSLPENRGMLFVYREDQHLSFWMKNTEIPLSIAFISKDGTIREIRNMEPFSLASVESKNAVRYALEVPQGNFSRLGIKPGDRFEIPPEALEGAY
jgi:uncharacterized membrane protein (UPF0127 family)